MVISDTINMVRLPPFNVPNVEALKVHSILKVTEYDVKPIAEVRENDAERYK